MSLRVWSWLFSLALLWGGSFFFGKVALGELPPFVVVFARVALAALALNLALAVLSKSIFRRDAPWLAYLGMGLLNNAIPFSLVVWGQTHISSGLASILNATTPLFTVVVAHCLTTDEKLNSAKAAALLAGLAGVVLLVGPEVLTYDANFWSEFACLAAALSYAFAGIFGRRFRRMGVSPMEAAAGQVTASTALILPIILAVDKPWEIAAPSMPVCASLAALALLSTALAYILYFRILAAAGATNLLLVTFMMPLIAILLGAAILDERLQPRHFAGMALIGVGLAVIDGRIATALRPAK
jgi:drug/metabolite transporter (DMT)-like permease